MQLANMGSTDILGVFYTAQVPLGAFKAHILGEDYVCPDRKCKGENKQVSG